MARKTGLSLTDDIRFKSTSNPAPEENRAGTGYTVLNADDIRPSPYNEGLSQENIDSYVASMKESGLIEPIAVYDLGGGKYEILSGHQRYEAWCNRLGNRTIKAIVYPYEKDPVKRFKAHTEANVLTRNKDLRFWLSRIGHAKQVLHETGFTGTRAEELALISDMLHGISAPQLYRYESFTKLIPDLQEFESRGYMSANTLYLAVGLDDEQQMEVAERVRALQRAKVESSPELMGDREVTREEFAKICRAVRKGESPDTAPRKKSTYTEKFDRASAGVLKIISRSRTQAERKEALECIARLQLQLDELKSQLAQN